MLYNREEVLRFFGSVLNDPKLLRDRKYDITENDFDDLFHKQLFAVLQNLALEGDLVSPINGLQVDSYMRKFPIQHANFEAHNGIEYIEKAKQTPAPSFDYSYKTIRKLSLLRKFKMVGMDIRDILDENTLDIKKREQQQLALQKLTIEQIKQHFKMKLIEIDMQFQTNKDSFYFKAGEDIEDLLQRCKQGASWGATFQSKYFNSVFRGMQGSKLMIRSAGTGGGKSRQSLGDMCNISVKSRYCPIRKQWIVNPKTEDTVFISTELTKDEVHLAMLSTVAGVPEETIKGGKYTKEEDERLQKATALIKDSKMHCEYSSNFSITEIENIIEKNIIRNGAKYVFFDYIQITSNLSRELTELFGYVLREDQMLNQLSTALKNLANKYNVFILTSTQLNRSYKTDAYPDATWLRGGMSVADKCDYAVITLKTSKADLDKLSPILENGFGDTPTHAHHIIKNRGGKWVGIILWVVMDLDTINVTKDCFVTTQDYELISGIVPVQLT